MLCGQILYVFMLYCIVPCLHFAGLAQVSESIGVGSTFGNEIVDNPSLHPTRSSGNLSESGKSQLLVKWFTTSLYLMSSKYIYVCILHWVARFLISSSTLIQCIAYQIFPAFSKRSYSVGCYFATSNDEWCLYIPFNVTSMSDCQYSVHCQPFS